VLSSIHSIIQWSFEQSSLKNEGMNRMRLQMHQLLYVAFVIVVKNKIYINGEWWVLFCFFDVPRWLFYLCNV